MITRKNDKKTKYDALLDRWKQRLLSKQKHFLSVILQIA